MGSSSIETNQSSLTVENKHEPTGNDNLTKQSSPSVDGVDAQTLSKKLSSSSSESSSSPASPLDDPFGKDEDESSKSAQCTNASPECSNDAHLDDGDLEKTISGNTPKHESPKAELPVSVPPTVDVSHSVASSLGNLSTRISPANQVMERPPNPKYRIPSHVFARSKSTAPVEWSTASDESLFSIHMGNMSLTRDQFLKRLEELGEPGEYSSPGHMFSYSANRLPSRREADSKSQELETAKVVETIEEDQRESEDQNHEKSEAEGHLPRFSEGHISRYSEGSCTGKSFAFPILTDIDKNSSISLVCSSRIVIEQQQTRSQSLTMSQPQPQLQPETQPQTQLETKAPAATPPSAWTKWFSCFSCCSFCG